MTTEKDICELHEQLVNYINHNILSSNQLKILSRQFKRLLAYMDKNSIALYSKKVGREYLIHRALPGNNRRKHKTSYRYEDRYITLLNGMLEGKWVEKVSRKDYDAPFPGAIGKYVMNFLKKYVEVRRLSILTRNNYYTSLFKFCKRMEFDNITSLEQITAERILDFVSSVQNCKDHIAIILRALLKQLYDEKIVDYRTATILENLKTKPVQKLPSYYTPMEIRGIEEAVNRKTPMGKRDYAMLILATRLGLRTSDIRLLQFSSIDWDNNLIFIEQYKTGRLVELPLLTDVGEAIIDYIQHSRPKSESKYIFLRLNAPYEPLTSTGVYGAFNKHLKRSHVNWVKRRHGGHAMRHSLATNMLKKGTPIVIISDSLGHVDSVTTTKYIHLNTEGLLKCSMDVPEVDRDFYSQKGDGIYE